jgi:hypothetical protein
MNDSIPGFDVNGVRCIPAGDDPDLFYYLPPAPGPELGPSGLPTLRLLVTGQTGFLQFGARWAVDSQTLESVRAGISQKFPDRPLNLIRLVPAPVSIKGVTLQITDGRVLKVVQTVLSSGYPPYTAVFSVTLDGASVARAISSIQGNSDMMAVRYDVILSLQTSVEATIKGDLQADLAALDNTAQLSDCKVDIGTAIQAGRLIVQYTNDGAPTELRQKAYDSAVEKAAIYLYQLLQSPVTPDSTLLEVSVTATGVQDTALTPLTDVATWIPSGHSGDYINVVSSGPT